MSDLAQAIKDAADMIATAILIGAIIRAVFNK